MKKKILLLLIISVLFLFVSCKAAEESVTVFADGKTEYSIVVASGASDDEKSLADGLVNLSGALPELITDASSEQKCEILIGETNRAASREYSEKLAQIASATYFHYIIAEQGGKIVIISDAEIGYIYALDHIEKNYMKDGSLVINSGAYDVGEILWDTYYATDLYLERLNA